MTIRTQQIGAALSAGVGLLLVALLVSLWVLRLAHGQIAPPSASLAPGWRCYNLSEKFCERTPVRAPRKSPSKAA